jgi:hypothetical protein
MAIIKQCEECYKIGTNIYCNNCIKSIDFFDVFRYKNSDKRFVDGESIGKIKAYTWHDAIEFIKNNFYNDQHNLDINCEKEFAYVEEKTTISNPISSKNDNKKKDYVSYKIYLNKEVNNESNLSSFEENKNVWDTTIIGCA